MDFKFWVSVYAATISTIVFIWRLYEFYYDRIGKLNISIKNSTRTNVYANGNISRPELFLIVEIVNIGKNKRFIEQPIFVTNLKEKDKKFLNLIRTDKIQKFPICLEPGEKFEYDLPFDEMYQSLKSNKVFKLKAIIEDTHRKKYFSKWFNI